MPLHGHDAREGVLLSKLEDREDVRNGAGRCGPKLATLREARQLFASFAQELLIMFENAH